MSICGVFTHNTLNTTISTYKPTLQRNKMPFFSLCSKAGVQLWGRGVEVTCTPKPWHLRETQGDSNILNGTLYMKALLNICIESQEFQMTPLLYKRTTYGPTFIIAFALNILCSLHDFDCTIPCPKFITILHPFYSFFQSLHQISKQVNRGRGQESGKKLDTFINANQLNFAQKN